MSPAVVAAATAAAIAPIIVAAARAVANGWMAIGDNANFLIRSRDVLTEHHPLLGTWTSASLAVGVDIDNPGPLYFDLLAAPAKWGADAGLAIGVSTLNAACVLLIAWFAWRTTDGMGALAAMVMAAGLAWTMGSELLFDPWQPHGLLFPVLLFLVLTWSLLNGDAVALPFATVVGSLVVQTHLSYALIVPVLGLLGMVGLGWRARRAPQLRTAAMRSLSVAVIAAGIAWAQPVAEQALGDGPGNLGKVLSSAGGSESTVGLPLATRLVGDIIATPPWWARPSFSTSAAPPPRGPSVVRGRPVTPAIAGTVAAVGALLVVVLGLGLLAVSFRGTPAGAAAALGPLLIGLALTTTAVLPVTRFGVPQHQLRFLWPAGLFITWALLLVLVHRRPAGRWPAAVLLAAAAALSAAAMPQWNPRVGPSADADVIPVVRELTADLDLAGIEGPVLFDLTGQRFAEPYTAPVMAAMQAAKVEFRVADEGMVGQLGPARRADGRERARVFVREGDLALQRSPGADRVAFATGMSDTDQQTMRSLRRREQLGTADRRILRGLEERWSRLTVAVFVAPMP